MKLYGAIASPYVTRVRMFARIKDVDLPLEEAPGGSPRSDEYRAVNPIGKIPSLEVDGSIIAESEVICEFLEDAFPDRPGLPADPLDRATSRLIARIVDLYIAAHTSTLFRQINPATRDQDVVASTGEELRNGLHNAEYFMGPGPFCVGGEPTVGDCALAPYMILLKKIVFPNFDSIPDPTEGTGRMAEWWQAIQGDDVCSSTVDEYGAAVDAFLKVMGAQISGQQS